MERADKERMEWKPALLAGLIAGAVLLIIPRGSPWSYLTFFSPVIMGRNLPTGVSLPLPVIWIIHLAVAEVYGLIISRLLVGVTQGRAILLGGAIGAVLYLINLGLVSAIWPAWRGAEAVVFFTHVVFGLIAGGAYRGWLRKGSY